MKDSKDSEWVNYKKRFFWRRSTVFNALLFVISLAITFSSSALASPGETNDPSSLNEYDDEIKLAQTIVYALPDKPVVLEWNNKGEVYRRGISVAKVLFGKANVDWKAAFLPIRRMFIELENGNANFAYFVKDNRADTCCITSEKPVFFIELGIYQAIGSQPFTQLADLNNRKVIVLENYQYGPIGEYINDKSNNVTLYTAAEHMTALSMLVAKRADYLLDYRVATAGIYEEAIKQNIAYAVLRKIELYMLLNKNYPNAKAVLRRLERIYHTIPKDMLNNPCIECIAGVREERGDKGLGTGDGRRATGDWELETGDWELETEDWGLATGNSKKADYDRDER